MKVAYLLFSAPMVCGLRADRKTQTRRTAAPRWAAGDLICVREAFRLPVGYDALPPAAWLKDVERLPDAVNPVHFEADGRPGDAPLGAIVPGKLRPSIHMPRRASRLTLRVEEVREERLRSISEADAFAEGVVFETADPPFCYVPGIWPHSLTAVGVEQSRTPAEDCYLKLWNHINGPGAAEANPLVYATTFSVEKANVDAILKREG